MHFGPPTTPRVTTPWIPPGLPPHFSWECCCLGPCCTVGHFGPCFYVIPPVLHASRPDPQIFQPLSLVFPRSIIFGNFWPSAPMPGCFSATPGRSADHFGPLFGRFGEFFGRSITFRPIRAMHTPRRVHEGAILFRSFRGRFFPRWGHFWPFRAMYTTQRVHEGAPFLKILPPYRGICIFEL